MSELTEIIRAAQERAWDAAVASLRYADGSPVEVIGGVNPYREVRLCLCSKPLMRCAMFGHAWYCPPIITLANLTYCRRCGARP